MQGKFVFDEENAGRFEVEDDNAPGDQAVENTLFAPRGGNFIPLFHRAPESPL